MQIFPDTPIVLELYLSVQLQTHTQAPQAGTQVLMTGHACAPAVMSEGGAPCVQGLETLVRLNGKAKEDLSEREQSSLAEYPLSLRILAQTSGMEPPGCRLKPMTPVSQRPLCSTDMLAEWFS